MRDGTFTTDRLLALYGRVAGAEDAIPRLRRFVLDLAVRGKLVEQDPADEPVKSVGLEIVAKKRGQMLETIDEPFELPRGWAWRAIDTISNQVTDGEHSTPPRISEHEVPLVTAKNVREGFMDYDNTDWVGAETAAKAWTRCRPQVGDLLLVCVGATTGRLTVLREHRDMVLVRSVALIRPSSAVNPEYLERAIRSPMGQKQIWAGVKAAAQPCLYINRIKSIFIPLPPLAEQQRIVAKVDELMALCDRLEATRAGREAVRDRLTAATWARLTGPETDAETFPTHARFALQTLSTLTTRPDQIKALRQAILNLAVRGKLVEQDPTDEPAAELLRRINAAHPRQKKIQDNKVSVPSQLADGWSVAHLDALANFENGDRSSNYPSGSDIKSAGIPFFSTKNLADHRLHFSNLDFITDEKFASLRSGKLVDRDILITLRGSVGKFGLFEATPLISTGFINAQLMIIRCADLAIVPYVLRFMQSGIFSEQIKRLSSGSATPQLSAGKLGEAELWLPPLAEQHRIVARVDALMALCDQLAASLTTATTSRSRLLEALLHEALEPRARAMEAAE